MLERQYGNSFKSRLNVANLWINEKAFGMGFKIGQTLASRIPQERRDRMVLLLESASSPNIILPENQRKSLREAGFTDETISTGSKISQEVISRLDGDHLLGGQVLDKDQFRGAFAKKLLGLRQGNREIRTTLVQNPDARELLEYWNTNFDELEQDRKWFYKPWDALEGRVFGPAGNIVKLALILSSVGLAPTKPGEKLMDFMFGYQSLSSTGSVPSEVKDYNRRVNDVLERFKIPRNSSMAYRRSYVEVLRDSFRVWSRAEPADYLLGYGFWAAATILMKAIPQLNELSEQYGSEAIRYSLYSTLGLGLFRALVHFVSLNDPKMEFCADTPTTYGSRTLGVGVERINKKLIEILSQNKDQNLNLQSVRKTLINAFAATGGEIWHLINQVGTHTYGLYILFGHEALVAAWMANVVDEAFVLAVSSGVYIKNQLKEKPTVVASLT